MSGPRLDSSGCVPAHLTCDNYMTHRCNPTGAILRVRLSRKWLPKRSGLIGPVASSLVLHADKIARGDISFRGRICRLNQRGGSRK